MFYKTDFIKTPTEQYFFDKTNYSRSSKGSKFFKHNQLVTISGAVKEKKTVIPLETGDRDKKITNIRKLSLWQRYCDNTTIHGIKYTSDKDLHWFERLTWIILVIAAIFGIAYFSFLISKRFSSSPLSTVIESIIYPVSEISYPAVTFCNYNRINWLKLEQAHKIFLPNDVNNETIETFNRLVMSLEILEFGSFELFEPILNRSLKELEHVNLTKLFEIVMPDCDDLFVEPCWWRNKYLSCCSIFFKQKSEYGICYSFNSLTSIGHESIANMSKYPWRTSNYGDWSGLRVTVKTETEHRVPHSKNAAGFLIMVNDPNQWPGTAYFIPVGTTTSVILKPTYSYATAGVNRLELIQRNCLLAHEVNSNEYFNLPDMEYLRANCLAECRQRNMIKYCNCTAGFMYPTGNYTDCNISGMACSYQYDKNRHKFEALVDNDPVLFEIWDTCFKLGTENELSISNFSEILNWADGIFLVYSITDRKSFNYIKQVKRELNSDMSLALLGNKVDMIHLRQVSTEEGEILAKDFDCRFFEVSAAEHVQPVIEAFHELCREVISARRKSKQSLLDRMLSGTRAYSRGKSDSALPKD